MAEIYDTTQPEVEAIARRELRERWAPLGLVLAGGFWNFFVSPMGQTASERDWWVYPIYVVLGTLIAQPMLCAVWGAWSAQTWIWRLPLGLSACVFLSLTAATHGDVGNMLVGMVGIHLLLLVVLAFIQRGFQTILTARYSPNGETSPNVTFGMRYLFLWMTVAAVLTGLGRMLTFGTQNWGPGIGETVTWVFADSVLLAPPAWLLVYLLRPAGLRLRDVVAIVLSAPLAALIPSAVLWFESPGSSFGIELYLPTLLITVGAMAAVAVVATVLRWADYRIYRSRPS